MRIERKHVIFYNVEDLTGEEFEVIRLALYEFSSEFTEEPERRLAKSLAARIGENL